MQINSCLVFFLFFISLFFAMTTILQFGVVQLICCILLSNAFIYDKKIQRLRQYCSASQGPRPPLPRKMKNLGKFYVTYRRFSRFVRKHFLPFKMIKYLTLILWFLFKKQNFDFLLSCKSHRPKLSDHS